jgi:hypothetical protein
MQAIITKYLPATNFKGARIKASCDRGSAIVPYPHELSGDACHVFAADYLVGKFMAEDAKRYGTEQNPWARARACGQLSSGEYVHVFATPEKHIVVEFLNHDDLTYFRKYYDAAKAQAGTVSGVKCGLMCSALKRAKI